MFEKVISKVISKGGDEDRNILKTYDDWERRGVQCLISANIIDIIKIMSRRVRGKN